MMYVDYNNMIFMIKYKIYYGKICKFEFENIRMCLCVRVCVCVCQIIFDIFIQI